MSINSHSSSCHDLFDYFNTSGHNKMYHSGVYNIVCWLCLIGLSHASMGPLYFPAASVLQITATLSVPVEIPGRKLFWDWGLQMNYALPAKPSAFYNAAIWPDELARRHQRQLRNETAKYLPADADLADMHASDFTAGELYESLESMLKRYGFDESCLLRSVCELARHPFDEQQENLLTALLRFTLTPSLHEAFGANEQLYRTVYEEAEQLGFLGADCAKLYADCQVDVVSAISKLIS